MVRRPRHLVGYASLALLASSVLGTACGDAGEPVETRRPGTEAVSLTPHPGIVDHSKVTTVPFRGYPTYVARPSLGPDELPTCQAPADERPDPSLPPLSCRFSGSEPPPGAINTPAPDEIPDARSPDASVPPGWMVLDNRLFRYTVAIPPGWYANMRPEGGEFRAFDDILTAAVVRGRTGSEPAGIAAAFSARLEVKDITPGYFVPDLEERLQSPNADFGGHPGAIWDHDGEGAKTVSGAFLRDGVVYEFHVDVEDRGLTPAEVAARLRIGRDILATIRPY